MTAPITFADLSEVIPDADKPLLDKSILALEVEANLTDIQRQWRQDGVVILEKFIPDELIQRYMSVRDTLPGRAFFDGWSHATPYMQHEEILDLGLYEPLTNVMKSLIGDDMGMHLNLTGYVSTRRQWHQDDYLNPEHVRSHYLAIWVALDDIHPDAGPFEFIRGSHRWPLMRREKVMPHLTPAERSSPHWPKTAERFVTPAIVQEISDRGSTVEQFVAKKGDVLIWHGSLMHQGSDPKNPDLFRKAFISHYTALSHRPDMPRRVLYEKELVLNGKTIPISGYRYIL